MTTPLPALPRVEKTVYVGLGSNLHAPRVQVKRALAHLAQLPQTRVVEVAPLYRTRPVGVEAQPYFINTVVLLSTALSALGLLTHCLAIELMMGRRRTQRWGARIIDIDILCYAHCRRYSPLLHLPHPRMHQRLFVLLPLSGLNTDYSLSNGCKVHQQIAQLRKSATQESVY